MSLNLSKPILYLITRGATTEQTTPHDPEFNQILKQTSAAVAAGIDLIQIREKKLTARVLFELVSRAVQITKGTGTRLLVNDRADIATGAGADGVHLTTRSLGPATIRKAFGKNFLIGASTHSLAEARGAQDDGADFIVFGPVFETASKLAYGPAQGLPALSIIVRELNSFPVLALGGITLANAAGCLAAGAHGVAGISLFNETLHFDNLCNAVRGSQRIIRS
ncbi:MAG TPA: thiamine phosphate synthase [Pyrinomonadaceae bacterium]|jgi:thiamine-phosphate pyrophosphorylase|nr:thiamine phosphate synthase [Pyrinomonadaceae bacterium]